MGKEIMKKFAKRLVRLLCNVLIILINSSLRCFFFLLAAKHYILLPYIVDPCQACECKFCHLFRVFVNLCLTSQ